MSKRKDRLEIRIVAADGPLRTLVRGVVLVSIACMRVPVEWIQLIIQ